ncbi:MAG: hypothetical protein AAGA42_20375 [Actinomycetota bacterium]
MSRVVAVTVVALLALAACGDDESTSDATSASTITATDGSTTVAPDTDGDDGTDNGTGADTDEQRFPDVVGVVATEQDGTWSFDVTLSSPYDTPERYADAWRIVAPDGTVLGERPLAHDHQFEQPFTRSLGGVEIPADVAVVVVEGRDQQYGWGGATIEYALPGR